VCVVVSLDVPIVTGGRVFVVHEYCRAVFTYWPGPIATTGLSSESRKISAGVVVGVTGAVRFLVLLQKTGVVYIVLHLQVT
jgi:hypothetical protein